MKKKSCATRSREEGRHAVSKIRRVVNMKIARNSIWNIALMRESVIEGELIRQKSFRCYLSKRIA